MDINQCNSAWAVAHSHDKQPSSSPIANSARILGDQLNEINALIRGQLAYGSTYNLRGQLEQITAIMASYPFQQQVSQIATLLNLSMSSSRQQLNQISSAIDAANFYHRLQSVIASIDFNALQDMRQDILDSARAIASSPLMQKVQQAVNTAEPDQTISQPSSDEKAAIPAIEAEAVLQETGQVMPKEGQKHKMTFYEILTLIFMAVQIIQGFTTNPAQERIAEALETIASQKSQYLALEQETRERIVAEKEHFAAEKGLLSALDEIRDALEEFDDTPQNREHSAVRIVIAFDGLVEAVEGVEYSAIEFDKPLNDTSNQVNGSAELEIPPAQNTQSENEEPNGNL